MRALSGFGIRPPISLGRADPLAQIRRRNAQVTGERSAFALASSFGLAPLIVKEIFSMIAAMREPGVAILLVEPTSPAIRNLWT